MAGTEKVIGKIAGILGIFQGVFYVIISIICIMIYYGDLKFKEESSSYSEFVLKGIYNTYLNRDYKTQIHGFQFYFTPQEFIVGIWVYFFINLAWILSSVSLFQRSSCNDVPSKNKGFRYWIALTLSVFIFDIYISTLIGLDYKNCMDDTLLQLPCFHYFIGHSSGFSYLNYQLQKNLYQEIYCSNIILPTLFIINKGFMLWIINLILVIILTICSLQMQSKKTVTRNTFLEPPPPYEPDHISDVRFLRGLR